MLHFLVVGDWGRRGSPAQCAVAHGMARVARRLGSAFVLSTGDNFYDHGVESTADAHWQESFEAVYAAPSLRVPWYAALGNHDYQGNVDAQIAYARRHPRWRMPGRSYAFTRPIGPHATALFVVLDTTPLLRRYHPGGAEAIPGVEEQDAAKQLMWLRCTLATSSATWKLVAGHHPVLNGSPFHGPAPEMQQRLQPILEAGGTQAYLCGHEHDLQHLTGGGVHYVVSGAGAECRATGAIKATRFSQATLGFAACTLTPGHLHLRLCDAQGRVLHRRRIAAGRGVPSTV